MWGLCSASLTSVALEEGVNAQRHMNKHLGPWPIAQPSESRHLGPQVGDHSVGGSLRGMDNVLFPLWLTTQSHLHLFIWSAPHTLYSILSENWVSNKCLGHVNKWHGAKSFSSFLVSLEKELHGNLRPRKGFLTDGFSPFPQSHTIQSGSPGLLCKKVKKMQEFQESDSKSASLSVLCQPWV